MFKVLEERKEGASITTEVRECSSCKASAFFSRSCGVFVCTSCGEHEGLARCFCGWSLSGRSGYQELIEMGENIEDDY